MGEAALRPANQPYGEKQPSGEKQPYGQHISHTGRSGPTTSKAALRGEAASLWAAATTTTIISGRKRV